MSNKYVGGWVIAFPGLLKDSDMTVISYPSVRKRKEIKSNKVKIKNNNYLFKWYGSGLLEFNVKVAVPFAMFAN